MAKSKWEIPWWHEYYEHPEKRRDMLEKLPAIKGFTLDLSGSNDDGIHVSKKQKKHMVISMLEGLFNDAMGYAWKRGWLDCTKHNKKKSGGKK
jgi:hypothetical protein